MNPSTPKAHQPMAETTLRTGSEEIQLYVVTCTHCALKHSVTDDELENGQSREFILINIPSKMGVCRDCFSIPGVPREFYHKLLADEISDITTEGQHGTH